MEALKYPRYPEIPKEKESCPIKFKNRDKVVAYSNCKYEPKEYKGYVVGYWYDARNIENFYAVEIVGKKAKDFDFPVAVFPESRLTKYRKKR